MLVSLGRLIVELGGLHERGSEVSDFLGELIQEVVAFHRRKNAKPQRQEPKAMGGR